MAEVTHVRKHHPHNGVESNRRHGMLLCKSENFLGRPLMVGNDCRTQRPEGGHLLLQAILVLWTVIQLQKTVCRNTISVCFSLQPIREDSKRLRCPFLRIAARFLENAGQARQSPLDESALNLDIGNGRVKSAVNRPHRTLLYEVEAEESIVDGVEGGQQDFS